MAVHEQFRALKAFAQARFCRAAFAILFVSSGYAQVVRIAEGFTAISTRDLLGWHISRTSAYQIGLDPGRGTGDLLIDVGASRRGFVREAPLGRPLDVGQRVDGQGPFGFKSRYGWLLLQDVAQFVDSLQQAVFGKAGDRKSHLRSVGERDGLVFEVYLDGDPGITIHSVKKSLMRIAWNDDREKRVLQCVAAENIRERGADHGAKAVLT